MTDLNPEQHAEREAARRDNGEFGTHEHSAPELHLADGNGYHDVTYPATVIVRLERWDERDNAIEVGRVEFDARAIFDALSLSEIKRAHGNQDYDWIFQDAQTYGLTDEHDGPFTVDIPEDFEDYLVHRDENGMTDPYETAAEGLEVARVEHVLGKRTEALATAERLLAAAGDTATVTKKISELEFGDIMVQGENRLRVDETSPSSQMPGFIMVGTDFGYLYLDPDEEVRVEAF